MSPKSTAHFERYLSGIFDNEENFDKKLIYQHFYDAQDFNCIRAFHFSPNGDCKGRAALCRSARCPRTLLFSQPPQAAKGEMESPVNCMAWLATSLTNMPYLKKLNWLYSRKK